MKNNRYYTALTFWTMGEKYWKLSLAVSARIARTGNEFFVTSDKPITWRQYDTKTKWNDANMGIPLLFDFYHGIELMLKGFALLSPENSSKLDHGITQLYRNFKGYYPNQIKLIDLFSKYLDKSQMPDLLQDFLKHNRLSVDRFYESLRYPYNRNLSQEYQHSVLKYRGGEGSDFYRALNKDIEAMLKLVVALGRSLEK